MSDRFIFVGDIVEANGKTIKQNNMEIQHKIAVGTLVEIIPWDDECKWGGIRLHAVDHSRDCDGTPLYVLGCLNDKYFRSGGFGEDNIKPVGSPDETTK